jgi:nucleotide-binding universal stress UspA family protein
VRIGGCLRQGKELPNKSAGHPPHHGSAKKLGNWNRLLTENRHMYRTILVAVDGSNISSFGLEEAISLATELGATLCVLHVIEQFLLTRGLDSPDFVEGLLEALRDTGKKILAEAVNEAEQVGVTTRSMFAEAIGGPVADTIIEQAKQCGADMIVLGTHGRRGMSRLVMGSDAERVIQKATVPVMLVRTRRSVP